MRVEEKRGNGARLERRRRFAGRRHIVVASGPSALSTGTFSRSARAGQAEVSVPEAYRAVDGLVRAIGAGLGCRNDDVWHG